MSPISLILVASLTLVGFHSETTLAMDSGMDNGLQTVEDRAIDCNDEPGSMNAGATSAKGCAGAVWSDGSFSSDYCTNTGWAKGRFPWWGKCCMVVATGKMGMHRECRPKLDCSKGFNCVKDVFKR